MEAIAIILIIFFVSLIIVLVGISNGITSSINGLSSENYNIHQTLKNIYWALGGEEESSKNKKRTREKIKKGIIQYLKESKIQNKDELIDKVSNEGSFDWLTVDDDDLNDTKDFINYPFSDFNNIYKWCQKDFQEKLKKVKETDNQSKS